MRRLLVSTPAVVAAGLAYGAMLVFLRATPSTDADSGIFLSVIGRLLAGDRLYSDVFDNKDPLFFYTGALAVKAIGWQGLAALDGLWLAVGALGTAAFLRAAGATRLVAATGFVVYPLLLTGAWYRPGYSMLAALALIPVIGWLWLRERWVWAGVVLGLVLGFKANLALVALAAPLVALFMAPPAERVREVLLRFTTGVIATVGTLAAILAVRGELGPYLTMQRGNVTYANHVLEYQGRRGGVLGHLQLVVDETPHTPRLLALFVLGGALAVWVLLRRRERHGLLAALFLATSAATLVTFALTAAWVHHMQLIAYPATLLLAVVVAFLMDIPGRALLRAAAAASVVVASLWALSTWDDSGAVTGPRSLWWSAGSSASADVLEDAAARRHPPPGAVTYARLGRDDDDAHGLFLDHRFNLTCPRFHQHLHTEDLEAVVDCLERRRPQLVLTGSGFAFDGTAPDRWNAFVQQGEALLEREYAVVLRRNTPRGRVTIWERTS